MSAVGRTGRFASAWIAGRPAVEVREVVLPGPGDQQLPASRYAPASGGKGPSISWIVLHGLTRPGRHHASLIRFARALAATDAVVLVPEIAAWRDLDLHTDGGRNAVLAACSAFDGDPSVAGKPGLVGFSFGGPQVLRMAADPELSGLLSGAAAFGGYGDLASTLRFQMTGEIEADGAVERMRPDPYARWIVGANFLTDVPGWERAHAVTGALRSLAMTAGDQQIPSWDPIYDPLKVELRSGIVPELRPVFDLFAPPSAQDPPGVTPESEDWIEALATAALNRAPDLELPPGTRISIPSHILHGRFDPLIPWTEAAELASRIVDGPTPTITRIFSHSAGDDAFSLARPDRWAREVMRLGAALGAILTVPE